MIVKLKPDSIISEYYNLTKDKEYKAEVKIIQSGLWYKIKCDDGKYREFSDTHFISKEERRDKKLDDLGIS